MARFSLEDEGEMEGGEKRSRQKRSAKKRKAVTDSGESASEEEKERRRDEGSQGDEKEAEEMMYEEEKGGDIGSSGLTVDIDPDLLDCSVCFEGLSAPVFQCQNGHILCSSCCVKLKKKCHVCSKFIGNIRCLAMEKMIESMKIHCPNAQLGCKELLSNNNKHLHQDFCLFSPCFCPWPLCTFSDTGLPLALHFDDKHKGEATSFSTYDKPFRVTLLHKQPLTVLRPPDWDVLFILLNDSSHSQGNAVSLSCISPNYLWGFNYMISATGGNGSSLQLSSKAPKIRKWDGTYPCGVFLLIPHDFFAYQQIIILEVSISKEA